METLSYWLARLEPLIRAEDKGEIIVVLANRTGIEDDAVYAGTSAVLGIHCGEVKLYGVLGRGERALLVVDTSQEPHARLVSEPKSAVSTASTESQASMTTHKTTPELEACSAPVNEPVWETPTQPASPTFYLSPNPSKPEEQRRVSLSIASENHGSIPSLVSPGLKRPEATKSRNTSQTRDPLYQGSVLISPDLLPEPISRIIDKDLNGNGTPCSVPDVTVDDSWDSERGLGPPVKSRSISPRPRSTLW